MAVQDRINGISVAVVEDDRLNTFGEEIDGGLDALLGHARNEPRGGGAEEPLLIRLGADHHFAFEINRVHQRHAVGAHYVTDGGGHFVGWSFYARSKIQSAERPGSEARGGG